MRAGEAERARVAGDEAQDGGTLENIETVVAEPGENRHIGGDGRSVDNQCVGRIAEGGGDAVGILLKADLDTFGAELVGQSGRCAVVACHVFAFSEKIVLKGGHADAAGTDEIYVLYFG